MREREPGHKPELDNLDKLTGEQNYKISTQNMALTYQSNMLVCRMTKDQNTCQSGESHLEHEKDHVQQVPDQLLPFIDV